MILDEADRLLEMGFKEDIEHIATYLPKKKQTFLFSATISRDVKSIAETLLLPGHKFIDTVPVDEEPTHMKVKQSFLISSHSKQLTLLHQIIRNHMAEQNGGKIIVFFPTTKLVNLMTEIFSKLPGIDIIEMHSQLSQMMREKNPKDLEDLLLLLCSLLMFLHVELTILELLWLFKWEHLQTEILIFIVLEELEEQEKKVKES